MKKFQISLLFLFINLAAFSQENQLFDNISTAFKNNDYQSISNEFAESLDLNIETTDGTFGKKQASIILKDFLTKNKVSLFKISHNGSSNEKTQYAIAQMKSRNKEWSVYILINSNNQITQLQIEKE